MSWKLLRLRCAWWVLRGRSVMFRVVVAPTNNPGVIVLACHNGTRLIVTQCSFRGLDYVTGTAKETFREGRRRSRDWIEDPLTRNRYDDAWMRGEQS